MATQNHTATFLSFRENYQRRMRAMNKSTTSKQVHPLSEGLAANQFDADEESLLMNPKYTLPPTWVDSKDGVEGIISYLEEGLRKLEELHKERIVVRFNEENEADLDRNIDNTSRAMTKKFKEAEDKLRDIGRIDSKISDSEATIRKNVQRKLATRLQTISLDFRKSQKDYMMKLQSLKGGDSIFGNDSSMNSSANSTSSAFLMSQEEEQESLSKKIQHRDQEITKIAKSVQELAVIFKELAALVIEQGTILDRIDYNMDMVVDRTERGVKELEKAEQYSRSNRANYCIFALVVLIVIFFAMILAKLS